MKAFRNPLLTFGLFAAVFALAVCAGCGKRSGQGTVYREGESPVTMVGEGDKEMEAAIQKAEDSLDEFIAELKDRRGREFSVKSPFQTDSGKYEHLWVMDVVYANGKFKGTLGNNPLDIKSLRVGDPVEVDRNDVSDWIIMDGEKMSGGFTVDVLMKREGKK